MTTFAEKAIYNTQIIAFRAEFEKLMSGYSWCEGALRDELTAQVRGFIKAVRTLRIADDSFSALADEFAEELNKH